MLSLERKPVLGTQREPSVAAGIFQQPAFSFLGSMPGGSRGLGM